jgi:hypothetical protein
MSKEKCTECGVRVTKSGKKGLTKAAKKALEAGKYVCNSCRD